MTEWYYASSDHQQKGPVSAGEILRLLETQEVTPASLIWRDGMNDWSPVRQYLDELKTEAATAVSVAAPVEPVATEQATSEENIWTTDYREENGLVDNPWDTNADSDEIDSSAWALEAKPDEDEEVSEEENLEIEPMEDEEDTAGFSPYSASAAPLTMNQNMIYSGGVIVYAGFWKRVAASVVDGFIVGMAANVITFVMMLFFGIIFAAAGSDLGMVLVQLVANLLGLALYIAYFAAFHSSSRQATPGKMLIGIKVTRTDGSRITPLRGVGRYLAFLLNGLTLGIGFLMAAFTERKQCLHDMICDTLVVDKWAFTEHPEWQNEELGTATIVILAIWGVLLLTAIVVILLLGAAVAASFGGR